jgi:hypothetical protein
MTRKGMKQQCVLFQKLEKTCSCVGILADPHTKLMPTVAEHLGESQTARKMCVWLLIHCGNSTPYFLTWLVQFLVVSTAVNFITVSTRVS